VPIFQPFRRFGHGQDTAGDAEIIGATGGFRQILRGKCAPLSLKSRLATDTVAAAAGAPENPKRLKDKQESLACA